MKKDRAQVTRRGWAPRQFVEAARALLRRQGVLRKASRAAPTRRRSQASQATIPARSTSAALRARVAALTLALLLYTVMGAVEAIATTYAAPSNLLAASAPARRPTGTPWGERRTPTPPASPSPAFTTTPSETPRPQPAVSATTRTAPPPRENQMRVHQSSVTATSPTDAGEHPSPDRPGSVLRLLALVMAILGSSACAVCLLALGLRRLRKHLLFLKARKLISPAARNWQRVRPGSLDGDPGSVSSGSAQTLPSAADDALVTSIAERTTEPSLPVVGNGPLSPGGFSLTTSHIRATPKANGSLPRVPAGVRLRAAMRKRREDRDAENVPSLHDPGGEEALEEYIRKGRLAWQSRGGEQARG
ncbi:MAG TPA: hypothetical protein VF043_16625 [Ktedonobacteraceae bacterium]